MKIYTKTGDSGTTSLFGGARVDKNTPRIKAYGAVDELNSLIGVIIAEVELSIEVQPLIKKLLRIQTELFVLGADLATPKKVSTSLALRGASKVPRITKSFVTRLEREIDSWSRDLPQLKNFILPGGGKIGAHLHLARTIARRAERSIVDLAEGEKINKQSLRSSSFGNLRTAGLKNALVYINRLSDWLFVAARYVNKLEKVSEVTWKGRG